MYLLHCLLFIHPVVSDSLWHPWTAACLTSLSLTISWSLPKFLCIALVMPSSHLVLWHRLLLLPSIFLPASVTFPLSQLFTSDDQITGASASTSVLPTSIKGHFPLRLTGLISLLSKNLIGVFSTTVRRHQLLYIISQLLTTIWLYHLSDQQGNKMIKCIKSNSIWGLVFENIL